MCHEIRRKKSLRWHYPLCADCYITPHAYIGGIWTAQVKKEDKHVSNLWSPLTVATQLSWNITSASPLQIKFPCAPGISVGVATHSQPEVARDQIGVKNMGRRKSFNHESTCSFQKLLSFLGEAHKNLAFSISLEPSCDDFEGLLRSLFLRRWRCSFSWRISVKQPNISSNWTPSCSFLLGTGRSLQNHHFYQPNSWIFYETLPQISPLASSDLRQGGWGSRSSSNSLPGLKSYREKDQGL